MPTFKEFKEFPENNKGYLVLFGIAIIGVVGLFFIATKSKASKQKHLDFLNKISYYKK